TAIIAAGGRGLRLGGDRPKQLIKVGGRTILERSVGTFLSHAAIAEVVVALPADLVAEAPAYLGGASKPLRVVQGGAPRQDSGANAVEAASPDSEILVIHDAARPFASADLITRTIDAARANGAALAALAARDTVKRVERIDAGRCFVHETLPRDRIVLAQTP